MNEMPRIYRAPRIARPEEFQDTEPVPKVEAFQTERGSIYAYDNLGRTTRNKIKTGEIYEAQDLTVFASMDPKDKDDYVRSLHHSVDENERVYVVEKQSNGAAKKIRRPEQVQNSEALYLIVCQIDPTIQSEHNITHVLKDKKVSLNPELGSYVYDTRSYTAEDGKHKTERHLGHRITEIKYADS
jgi:hypothetical protein